ncbi:hypothetical protein DPMN_170690 [Dreissena polymorpha]|uniref:Uncharacterized protein n=1 Tax=Dreissena polymorpha TaxID=45954 RepID=A0A9D4DWM4_DREPO|nr:hypothetical protein DPMN_170690 [Dreissena polymorpha]
MPILLASGEFLSPCTHIPDRSITLVILNASSTDGKCNVSFDWPRKEKQPMEANDTGGRWSDGMD